MAGRKEEISKDTEEYARIEMLLATRDLDAFKSMYKSNSDVQSEIIG